MLADSKTTINWEEKLLKDFGHDLNLSEILESKLWKKAPDYKVLHEKFDRIKKFGHIYHYCQGRLEVWQLAALLGDVKTIQACIEDAHNNPKKGIFTAILLYLKEDIFILLLIQTIPLSLAITI